MKKFISPFIILCLSVITNSCTSDKIVPPNNITYPAAFVVNAKDNSISVIDLTDNTMRDNISLNGSFPYHIYISPNKKWLAVSVCNADLSNGFPTANFNSYNSGNKIIVIDALTKEIVKEINLPKLASNAIFNYNSSELWIGQADDVQSSILVYKTSNWELVNTIPVGKGLGEVTFCSDGDMSFTCTSADDSVQMYSAFDKSFLMSTKTFSHPIGAWPSDYHTNFILCDMNNRIYEVNADDCLIIDSMFLDFKPSHLAYFSNNSELWISDVTYNKVAWLTKSGMHWSVQGTIDVGQNPRWIEIDNDAKKVYVSNANDNTVSVIDANTHTIVSTISVVDSPSGIAIKK